MSDLLAVVGDEINDEDLLTEIARRRPDRVTVLAVEDRDDADSRSQLRGWRFDRVVGDNAPPAAKVQLTSRSTWS
jgi:hypothetical protein